MWADLVRRLWRPATRRPALPIFVISFNRGATLARVWKSYQKQRRRVRLIVHDNGSDDPATLDVLARLEAAGVAVYRHGKIDHADALNLVDLTVQAFNRRENYAGNYVVTDCDIDMDLADPSALDLYEELLARFGEISCVGPMLRISDIPRSYVLFDQVMKRHIEQFWDKTPEWLLTSQGRVAVLRATIDTTFAVYRGGERFRRLQSGMRVYAPYEARHLDWYPDEETSTAYRSSSSPEISHWNNADYAARFGGNGGVALPYQVVVAGDGGLNVAQRSTLDNPA